MKHSISLLLLLAASSVTLCADAIYNVSVNTGPYQGQSGYLDFQLGRGLDSQDVTVRVAAFASDGTLSGSAAQTAGAVTGALPGVLALGNTTQLNDYFRGFTYGTNVAFQLVFSGPGVNTPNGTAAYGSPFYFGLYNASQMPIGPADAFGNALLIQVNTNGSTRPQVYNSAVAINDTSVPEPTSGVLLAFGFGMLAWRLRKQRCTSD